MGKIRLSLRGLFRRLTRRFRRDLRFQIAFFYLLFAVPVVIVVFLFGEKTNDRLRTEVMNADTALARSIAQDLGLNLTNARYAAQELARYSRTGNVDPVTLEALYNRFNLARSLVNPVTLLGDWWIVENPVPLGLDVVPPEAFPFRDFARMSQLGGPIISKGRRSIQTHQPVATSIVPLWDEREEFFEYVVSNIRLIALSKALALLLQEYPQENFAFDAVVIDAARHIVAYPDTSLLLTSPIGLPDAVMNAALEEKPGSAVYLASNDVETLYSYAPIPGTDWGVIISRPADDAFAIANAFTRSMTIVASLFIVVGILFWLALSHQVIRPLEKLAAFGQSIRTDEPLPGTEREKLIVLAHRSDQVGHLTDTLVRMQAAIDARLDALIQSLRDALILENLEGKVIYANRQMGLLTERAVDEIEGAPVETVLSWILADSQDAARVLTELEDNERSPAAIITEFDVLRRGRRISLRLQVFNVTDSQGALIGRGRIFSDVTADREIDRMKSRLVSTVSHELRTPLASIKGYATTLLAEDVEWSPQAQREFLEVISAETDRLSAMVTDLLDLSKIEANSLILNRSEVRLDTIIQQAGRQVYPSPKDRLTVNLPPDLPALSLDRRLAEAIFRNLIENAVKYAGDDIPIYITAEQQNDEVVIYVQDEGPGIPEEHRERIFESFYRPFDDPLRMPSGFGLGLTIVRGFVELHGGKIWLEPCDTGACFAVSLPLQPDNAVPQ